MNEIRTFSGRPLTNPVSRLLAQILCLGAIAFGCTSAGNPGTGAEPGSADPVVARIGDDTIRLSEIDRRIKQDLFEESFGGGNRTRLYGARRETIDVMIDELLLAEAASAAGVSTQDWLAGRVATLGPIAEADVEAFFAENKERIGEGVTLDEISGRIRRHLERKREYEIVAGLRDASSVEVTLARERIPVEAVGHARGPVDARVTLVEFSDYECPFCGRAEPTVKALLERYPNDIRLVYRHLPLDFHPNALGAARAAVCAGEQDRFWAYHDTLFANQSALDPDSLGEYARQLELDIPAFETCLTAPETSARIERDLAAGRASGATGTPAFYINGIFLSGAQPLEEFEKIVAEELAHASP